MRLVLTMIQSEPELHRLLYYTQPVVLVDGITRTGKSMLGPILTSFQGVELERMEMILERIPQLYTLGKIKKDAAVAFLRLEIQMKLYESMISRNINFRKGDHSSVFSQVNPLRYLKRLIKKEGDSVVQQILEEKPIFQVQQHDVLGMSEIYFEALGDSLRILEMIRHPIDVIHSQYKRGYGRREDNDPRIFSFTIKHKDYLLPWTCYGIEEEYIASNQMDKVIRSYAARSDRLWETYNNLSKKQKRQVLLIPFEKFVTNPLPYLEKIELFIGRKQTRFTKKSLRRQRCPRDLNVTERVQKEQEIKSLASKECIKLMERLSQEYERIVSDL